MMPIGDETLEKIVAAVGAHIKAEMDSAVTHFQIIGEDIRAELRKEIERQKLERADIKEVGPHIDNMAFWQHLLGLLTAVGLNFDDLYSWVIKRARRK